MEHDPALVAAHEVHKAFGPTEALRGVNLELRSGEIHALLGENGAGKTTLVKVLVGALAPDNGEVLVRGEPRRFSSVRAAVAAGITPIYQELSLMPQLSVAENLAAFDLAEGRSFGPVNRRRWQRQARGVLDDLGLDISPRMLVSRLGLAERQLVEIARALVRDSAVLVLDEPTAALGRAEAVRLFNVLRQLRARGRAVLFITHRLDEVLEVADRVSVMRDGRMVLEVERSDVSAPALVLAMVGQAVAVERFELAPPKDQVVIEAERLTLSPLFEDVSFLARAGEVVGIVGLIGSGAEALGAALAGEGRVQSGRLTLYERDVTRTDRAGAQAVGIAYLPADRKADGLFPGLTVRENASAAILPQLARSGWLSPGREAARTDPVLERVRVRPADPRKLIGELSGGNQQKVLLARMLVAAEVRVLVASEPTRGVDIGARREIHRTFVEAAAGGAAVLIVTSDLDEASVLCHRLLIMRRGRLVQELPGDAPMQTVLGYLTGAAA